MAKVQTKPKDEKPVEQAPPQEEVEVRDTKAALSLLKDAEVRIAELEADLRNAQKLCDAEREGRVKAEQTLKHLGHDPSDLTAARQHIGPIGAPVAGPEAKGPLTFEERQELEDLEKRANKGRQLAQPTPHEMMRLGKLRARERSFVGQSPRKALS